MGKANESIFSGKPQPVSWCTECGAGLTKDNYCVECLNQTIADQQRVIDEIKETLKNVVDQLSTDTKIFSHEKFESAMKSARKLLGESDGEGEL